MKRHTTAERTQWEKDWLRQRMPHIWADPTSTRTTCTICHAKYTLTRAAGQRCPKRRKPNRWRMHLQRAWVDWHAEKPKAPTMDGKGILAQLRELEAETRRSTADDRWWKYSREARRYRRLMSAWWMLPASQTTLALADETRGKGGDADRSGWITAGRNRLVKRARENQQLILQVKGCTYTLLPSVVLL